VFEEENGREGEVLLLLLLLLLWEKGLVICVAMVLLGLEVEEKWGLGRGEIA
jgi:hypothetical protein